MKGVCQCRDFHKSRHTATICYIWLRVTYWRAFYCFSKLPQAPEILTCRNSKPAFLCNPCKTINIFRNNRLFKPERQGGLKRTGSRNCLACPVFHIRINHQSEVITNMATYCCKTSNILRQIITPDLHLISSLASCDCCINCRKKRIALQMQINAARIASHRCGISAK